MFLRTLCLGLALMAALAASGGCCNLGRKHCTSTSSAPPCCPSPCCDNAPMQVYSAPLAPGCNGR